MIFKNSKNLPLFVLFSFVVFIATVKGQNEDSNILIYPETEFDSISIGNYLDFISPAEGNLLLKDSITELGMRLIQKPNKDNKNLDSVLWGKVSILNPSISIQNCFLVIDLDLDSLVLFRLLEDKLMLEGKTIARRQPSENYILTSAKIIPVTLFPEHLHTFYFRIYATETTNLKANLRGFQLFQGKYFVNSTLKQKSLQVFGESITIFLGIVSLFVFFIFKSKDFLYFSSIIFLMFFLVGGDAGLINEVPQSLFSQNLIPKSGALYFFLFALLILFGSLFISTNLELKKYWVKFRKLYLFQGMAFAVLSAIFGILIWDGEENGYILLFLLLLLFLFLIWVILSAIAIVQGVVKKRINAVVLLVSFLLLVIIPMISSETSFWTRNMGSFGGFTLTSLMPFFLTIIYGMFTKVSKIQRSQLITQIEKQKSEELLYNILPEEVATELKEKGESTAKLIDQVSVLFTDFERFTEKSEKLSPQDLVIEINLYFKIFDDIIQKYDIEKIKTIGDAYMAAGGLNSIDAKPSLNNVIKAAIEMQAFMLARKVKCLQENKVYFEMRVGIHTGPIVAGVVGVKKFQYDIWGDTVNIANRMESNGKIGKVNISETTYEIVKDDPEFIFESRGKMNVKGKGEIEMWFVELRT